MPRPHQPGSPSTGFTFADLLRWTDATKSNLIHWTAIGLIQPDVEAATGSGHHKRYSLLNLIEVQLAATMNQLRVPTALIREGLRAFRDHHDLCKAVWTATPAGVTLEAQTALTPEQQRAVDEAYVQTALRRDAMHGIAPSPQARRRYLRAIRHNPDRLTDEQHRALLYHARTWVRFLREQAFRHEHFYGLFVFPGEDSAQIADEPLSLRDVVTEPALVIPLMPVIDYVDTVDYVDSIL